MKKIYVITKDLIFKTKIDTILKNLNLSFENFSNLNEINLALNHDNKFFFIIDLEDDSLNFSSIAEQKKNYGDKIFLLGYCSHVKNELIHLAQKSGFDEVMPRSKFVNFLPESLNNFDKLNK